MFLVEENEAMCFGKTQRKKEREKERTRGTKEENKSQMEKCKRDESFPELYMDVCIELASTLYPSYNNIKAQTATPQISDVTANKTLCLV